MEAAEVVPGLPARVLASDREVTRLGESVFRGGAVDEEALKATCAVLARMAVAYRKLDVVGVRVVATSAIRDTRNQREFLARAAEAVGAPVEIISGREEARLIHLGVESVWPQRDKRILIIDIGGGSAEIIAADRGRLLDAYSKPLGAVRLREAFVRDDPPAVRQIHQMHEYIQAKLDAPLRRLGKTGWDRVIATSATASAVAAAVARTPRSKRDSVDRLRVSTAQVRKLYLTALPSRTCRPTQDYRNRSAACGDYRARYERPAPILTGVSPAGVLLLASRRARRHYRGPGCAQRGR